jgi:uroporphyrinogen decarboxylase
MTHVFPGPGFSTSDKEYMSDKYSHRERIEMIIRGEKPDRFAASIWRHFNHMEHHAKGLAESMLDFQKRFDWDFMKINPRGSYHVEAWGNRLEWSHDEFIKHTKTVFTVKDISDWDKITVLPLDNPVLAEHLKAVSLISRVSDKQLPKLMTIFNPLSIAGDLIEDDNALVEHLKKDPDRVLRAIENITITFEKFTTELRNAGADGVFLATTQWASSDLLPFDDYKKFGLPFDHRIIKAAGDDALNLFHICASNNYLKEFHNFPAPLFNWDTADPTNLPADSGCDLLPDKTVIGGLDNNGWLWHGTPGEVATEIDKIKKNVMNKKFIFGPGCTIDAKVPVENLDAVRNNLDMPSSS